MNHYEQVIISNLCVKQIDKYYHVNNVDDKC